MTPSGPPSCMPVSSTASRCGRAGTTSPPCDRSDIRARTAPPSRAPSPRTGRGSTWHEMKVETWTPLTRRPDGSVLHTGPSPFLGTLRGYDHRDPRGQDPVRAPADQLQAARSKRCALGGSLPARPSRRILSLPFFCRGTPHSSSRFTSDLGEISGAFAAAVWFPPHWPRTPRIFFSWPRSRSRLQASWNHPSYVAAAS